jgi:DNA-directed RNA polymerase specialized sigma24 family protein
MRNPKQLVTDLVLDSGTGLEGPAGEVVAGNAIVNLSEVHLLNAMAQGEEDSLAEVYERHGSCVYALACRFCSPRQANNVTREVFLALWHAPGNVDATKGTLCSFLLAATHRQATMHLRADTIFRWREPATTGGDLDQVALGSRSPEGPAGRPVAAN